MGRPTIDCPRAALDALVGTYGGVRGALCAGSETLRSVAEDGGDAHAAACDAVSWLLYDAVGQLDESVRALKGEGFAGGGVSGE